MAASRNLPTAAGVASAYKLLSSDSSDVVRTPLLESSLLNEQLGTRLLVKAECLQRTGSFKYRGALHRLLRLQEEDPEAAARGVVAFSSGNFGQALAAAATSLQMKCCIVSPHDAPPIKLERIQQYGADLVLSEANGSQNREVVASTLAQEISKTKGMTLLHPFEDIDVVHGQGTTGMELLEQAQDILGDDDNDDYDSIGTIVVPCGGGGLTAGICLAVEELGAECRVFTVEPKGFDDHAQSFQKGQRTSLAELYPSSSPPHDRSVDCDALMAGAPGVTTWQINEKRLAGALVSSGDESAAHAMRIAFEHFRLVLEPSGALALAAVLDGQIVHNDDKAVVVIASGGNTDLSTFARLMGYTDG
jgi:threonine dehydratase